MHFFTGAIGFESEAEAAGGDPPGGGSDAGDDFESLECEESLTEVGGSPPILTLTLLLR
jgi:hypothetical protein